MRYPLAVIAPRIGTGSETFIRRHMEDLLPGRTVAFAETAEQPQAGYWDVEGPTLLANQASRTLANRITRAMKRRMRVPDSDPSGFKKFLQKHRVQVVMSEFLEYGLPYLPLARELGVRFYGHAHGYDVSRLLRDEYWRKEYLEYNRSDGIITVSHASRDKLINLGLSPDKIIVIPCCVDVPTQYRTRVETGTIQCVAVGRMVAKKAPIFVLDAFRRAAEAQSNLKLDYVGGGELFPAAQQFVHAFGLEDRVTLHGPQPREMVQEKMSAADIFLQHSIVDPDTGDEEGLPVAVLEAMACGLPVVSTLHAGIPEAVVEGKTGYLVAEGDSINMAERINALAGDPDLRSRLGCAGWQRANESFSWTGERSRLLQFLGLSASNDHEAKR